MNVFTATGNLGKDCRVNQTQTSTVCGFALAVKSGYGDNAQTLWVDCSLWGKQAESQLPQYLVKGAQVAVSGELGQREHEGKTYLTLRVASISLIGGKPQQQGQAQGYQQSQQGQYQAPNGQPMNPQQVKQQQAANQAPAFDNSFDDDLPF